jgi:hypothetical protein
VLLQTRHGLKDGKAKSSGFFYGRYSGSIWNFQMHFWVAFKSASVNGDLARLYMGGMVWE